MVAAPFVPTVVIAAAALLIADVAPAAMFTVVTVAEEFGRPRISTSPDVSMISKPEIFAAACVAAVELYVTEATAMVSVPAPPSTVNFDVTVPTLKVSSPAPPFTLNNPEVGAVSVAVTPAVAVEPSKVPTRVASAE